MSLTNFEIFLINKMSSVAQLKMQHDYGRLTLECIKIIIKTNKYLYP